MECREVIMLSTGRSGLVPDHGRASSHGIVDLVSGRRRTIICQVI